MKNYISILLILIVTAIFSSVIFGQGTAPSTLPKTDCQIIESGKGCGEIKIGASRNQIESLIGKPEAGDDKFATYYQKGLVVNYDSAQRVDVIRFIGDAANYSGGKTSFRSFAGKPDKNLSWDANRQQVIAVYGSPVSQESFQDVAEVIYNDIEFNFKNDRLTVIAVKKGAAENADDDDGDGVKNSDDVCPRDKGSKANKGCPGNDGGEGNSAKKEKDKPDSLEIELDFDSSATAIPKPTPTPKNNNNKEITSEEAKKQKDKLDSLKSNIDIMATPTPKPTPTVVPTPKYAVVNGTLADCKLILSEGCRNYFMNSTIDRVKGELGLQGSTYNRIISLQVYSKQGIELWVEPSSGRIVVARIDRYVLDWKPAKDVKWGESLSKIEKKYPGGKLGIRSNGDVLIYPNYELKTAFMEGLAMVSYAQEYTESELAAKKKRESVDDQITLERDRADTAYANSPAGIKVAFDSMHDQVESYANQANKKVEEFNKNQYIYEPLGKRKEKEDEIYQIRKKATDLIGSFMTKYAGKLPKEMIDHLNNDLEKLGSGKPH